MSSEFGLRGPKTPWVCPNDRQLALRAKLKTGWSVKTNQFNTYPKPAPLTEKEHQAIVSVIKKAEEMDRTEQCRVGKLVDRLESLRRLASGNGTTECVLCGDSFGLSVFGRTSYRCSDCTKAVCRKCVVDLSTTREGGKESILRLCKLCSENREFLKKSGAWFYKGVPKYILPEKKNHHYNNSYETVTPSQTTYQEQAYMSRYINSQATNLSSAANKRAGGLFWSKSLLSRTQSEQPTEVKECEESSGDETATGTKPVSSPTPGKSFSNFTEFKSGKNSNSSNTASDPGDDHNVSEACSLEGMAAALTMKGLNQSCDPVDPCTLSDNNLRSSTSSSTDCLSSSTQMLAESPLGTLEVSILYDDSHQALHCCLHKAKELISMDINGLSDPYCLLKLIPMRFEGTDLRTKTVHKTINPIFNETLTFYGVTQNDLAFQTLQINVMDEDRWGKDCLGSVQIPLHRIRPQQTRFFTLSLEKGRYSEDKDWGRGRLLLSLSYVTEKSLLLVGVVRAEDLPALDHSGTSDPFVKVRLLNDTHTGALRSSFGSLNRKFKTSVKWKTLNPEFQEEFSLKVAGVDLPRLTLVISVWDKDLGKNNDYIGGLILNSSAKGERLKQWTDMMKYHNTKHLKWHTLSPAPVPQ